MLNKYVAFLIWLGSLSMLSVSLGEKTNIPMIPLYIFLWFQQLNITILLTIINKLELNFYYKQIYIYFKLSINSL